MVNLGLGPFSLEVEVGILDYLITWEVNQNVICAWKTDLGTLFSLSDYLLSIPTPILIN